MPVRARFAPSPTGLLHIGGVRTALFNWLFARHQDGEFLLRIENTDTSREVEESVEQIQRSLSWLGLDWDGELEFQLDSRPRHEAAARQLLAEGHAYEDEGAVRFRMPDEGTTSWEDAIKGRIEYPNEKLEDLVLLRSDGRPTYNLAAALDDADSHITHVIRGEDHVSNTPKQIRILEALGREVPIYAHVPNVFGTDGKKLSKRHGAVSVEEFRAQGYLAPALMNYLALLGWSYDDKTTIMSRDELVERFSLDRVGSSPAIFDYAKLDWMNGVYLRELPPSEFADVLVGYLGEEGFEGDEETIRASAPLVQEKISRLDEYPGFAGFFFSPGGAAPRPAGRGRARARGGAGGPRRGRALHGGADRGGAARARGAPRPQAARGLRPHSRGRHRLEGLAGTLREPGAARPGRVSRPACPLAVQDEAPGEEGEPRGPYRPRGEHCAGREEEGAADDEQGGDDRRERRTLSVPPRLVCGGVGADRHCGSLERPQSCKAHAEERPAPLGQERLDQLDILAIERIPDLGGDVPRLGERRDELGVQCLAAGRRLDPDRELGPGVEAVLKLGQFVEEPVGDPVCGRLRDAFEPDESRAYALPEIRDGLRIASRLVPPNRPLHPGTIICGRGRRRPAAGSREARRSPFGGFFSPLISSSASRTCLRQRSVPSMRRMAPKPIVTFTIVITSCWPKLNARIVELVAAPASAKTRIACWVPAPPGVKGSNVESPLTTSTARVVSAVASTWKARRKKKVETTRASQLPACQETTSRT